MMRTRSLFPAMVLLGGCALRHRPAAPEPARGPAADSLFRLDQSRAAANSAKGSLEGMMSFLGQDLVYLRAGVPAVFGRDGVRELLAAPTSVIPPGSAWEPLGGAVSYDLMAGYTFGITARLPSEVSPIRLGKYIAVWRRSRDTPWQIIAYAEIDSPGAAEVNLAPRWYTPPLVALPAAMREATAKVRAADSLFSDLADRMGVGYALFNTMATQGVLFGGTPQLVIGPAAARDFYAAHGAGTSLTWHPVYAWAAGSQDLGFTIGEYIATGRGPSGAAVQRFGKYLAVWLRERDGTWKLVAGGGNGTPAKANDK